MRTRRNVLILLAAAVASTACGGSSNGDSKAISGSSGDKAATAPVTMAMTPGKFLPATLTGKPGSKQAIHFTNAGPKPHTFTIAAQSINTIVQPGATGDVTVTFPASGELVFVCTYHQKFGMVGKLIAGSDAAKSMSRTDSGGPNYY